MNEDQQSRLTDDELWGVYDAQLRATEGISTPVSRRLAFYGRCSTEDNQDPETSRQWQRQAAENLIAIACPGAEIVAEYFDVGHSRSLPWKRRPEAMRLLRALDAHGRDWDGIVVGEGQRCWFGSQFSDVSPIVQDRGVSLYVPEVGGLYDPENPTHYTLMTLTGGMSRGERQRVQARVRSGMAVQVSHQGRYQGGRPPYGYTAVGIAPHPNPRKAAEGFLLKRLKVDSSAAPVVRRIFERTIAGDSPRAIAAALNGEGIPCPSAHDPGRNRHRDGDGWQGSTIRAILANERYTGYEQWGKFRKEESLLDPTDPSWGTKTRFVRSDTPPIRSRVPSHEAIVTVEEFLQAQEALRVRSAGGMKSISQRSRAMLRTTPDYALRGLVYCSHCNRKMWADRYNRHRDDAQKPRFVRYVCRKRDLVENSEKALGHPARSQVNQVVLLDRLAGWLGNLFAPENRDATLAALTEALDVPDMTLLRRQNEVSRLADAERRLARLFDAIEAGVEPEAIAARVHTVQEEIDLLRSAVASTPVPEPVPTQDAVDALLDELATRTKDVFGGDADPAELHRFLSAIGLRITYDTVTNTATAEAALAGQRRQSSDPHLQDLEVGVSDRVRGGT